MQYLPYIFTLIIACNIAHAFIPMQKCRQNCIDIYSYAEMPTKIHAILHVCRNAHKNACTFSPNRPKKGSNADLKKSNDFKELAPGPSPRPD